MIGIDGRVSVIVRDYQSGPVRVSANRAIVLVIENASDVARPSGNAIDDHGYVSVIGNHRRRES